MDIKVYIESGVLELYVAGTLSEKENKEVYVVMQQHPEILKEVLDIEAAIIKLTAALSKKTSKNTFEAIKQDLGFNDTETEIISIAKPKYNWVTYSGWAASIVLATGLLWTISQNDQLKTDIQISEAQQSLLETQIANSKNSLEEGNTLIKVLRDDNITKVALAGQGNFTNTYAKVYWDKDSQRIFLDAQGLPEAPKGMIYQVWSLTLNPLTPTSLGTIDNFNSDDNKIFEISNPNESQAFGITLEPAGGSAMPTMEQLYTLGAVTST